MDEVIDSKTEDSHSPVGDHLEFIDGLRGAAALFVVFHHAFLQVFFRAPAPGVLGELTNWLVYGRFSVDAFIVLSGYCLMLPVAAGKLFDLRKYIYKRSRRILPPFYFALMFAVILGVLIIPDKTGTLWDLSLPITVRGVVANVLMVQDVWHTGEINPVFWSLAVEAKIYVFFPLLVLGWSRLGAAATSTLAIGSGMLMWWLTRDTPLRGLTAYYLCLFTFGMIACDLSKQRRAAWQTPLLSIALILIAAVILLCRNWGWQIVLKRFEYIDVLVGLATGCVLIYCLEANWVSRSLMWRPLVFLGTFAYSLYLIHAPLLQVVSQFVVIPLRLSDAAALAVMFGSIPFVCAIAFGFFLWCERPFMSSRLKRAVHVERRDAI